MAQEKSVLNFKFPEKLPNAYDIDVQKEFSAVKKESTKLVSKAKVDQFAEQMVAYKVENILSGKVYLGWSEMETYLNNVLKQIAPDSCKKNPRVHVYPTRESNFNAYAIHDGSIFFNVSLFAEVTNEAGIAFILSHELSHYIHRDVIKSYNKRREISVKKKKRNDDSYASYEVEMAEYGREQEKKADSLGAVLAANAGYDLSYAVGTFYKLKGFTEHNYQKSSASRVALAKKNDESASSDSLNRAEDMVLADHDDELTRIKYLRTLVDKFNKADAKEFIVSPKELYYKLQENSRFESLDLLLGEIDYRECVSRSFNYYLLQGSDQYLYYLLEGIRRGFQLNRKLPGKPFLTEDLREGIFKKGEGVLHDLHAQIRDTNDYKNIKLKEFTGKEILFETWDDAFNFFADRSIEKNVGDCYLPIALRNNDTIPLMNFYLDKYIAEPGVKYLEFAKAIRQDKLLKALDKNSRNLVLLNNISFSNGTGDNYSYRYFQTLELKPEYSASLRNMVDRRFDGREYIDETELKKTNFKQFYEYETILDALLSSSEVLKKTMNSNNFKEDAVNEDYSFEMLFYLNPDLWNIFRENKIRSIQYIRAISYRKKESFWPMGSYDSFYNVLSCYADIKDQNGIYFDYDQVMRWKMTKPYFLNTVYHSINSYYEK